MQLQYNFHSFLLILLNFIIFTLNFHQFVSAFLVTYKIQSRKFKINVTSRYKNTIKLSKLIY